MPDSYLVLAKADAASVLSLNQLPHLSAGGTPLLFRSHTGQPGVRLAYQKQTGGTPAASGKLVAFGDQLTATSLYTLLSRLCPLSESSLSLHCHQPLADMDPAAVVSGFTNIDAIEPLVMDLANELSIELSFIDKTPSLSQPGLLIMDMDSTAIEIECIDELAELAGVGDEVAAVTRRAMAGELDFSQSLRLRVGALKGADESIMATVGKSMPLIPGLESLVAYLQARDWKIAIASGGFTYFTELLKDRLHLTATFANQMEIVDGKLTGRVLGDIVDANAKACVVESLSSQHQIPMRQTIAIGDGANDLKMINRAALGVAFHAKPMVRQQAKASVNKGSLMQLLYLLLPQGQVSLRA